jgi:hypothetical protein
MIDRVAACEDHAAIFGDLDLLFSEVFGRDRFKPDKGAKFEFYRIFPG